MEGTVIKTEPPEVYTKPQTLTSAVGVAAPVADATKQPAIKLENEKGRCGEIFVTNNARKWTFTCTFCEKTTRDIGEFICHIQFKHMNGQYTEEDDNGDNEDKPQPMSITTAKSFENQDANILYQSHTQSTSKEMSQPFSLTTPTIAQVSSLANSNIPAAFDANTNFEHSDSTNSIEELSFSATTSQQHSAFTATTANTQNTNKGKRKPDNKEYSKSANPTSENYEKFFVSYANEVHDNETVIIDNDNDEMVDNDEEDEFISDDDAEYNKLMCTNAEPHFGDNASSGSGGQERRTTTIMHGRAYCSLCDRYFQHYQHYRNHMIKHTVLTPYNCEFCNKTFRSHEGLRYHIKTHTQPNEYKCPVCTVCYCAENQFITHVLTHESDACCPCMVCGKILPTNEERDEHLKTHEQERPYGCHFCKRRFRQHNFLTNHLRKHCQYRCEFCLTDFRLTQAQRRPYACAQCEKLPDIRQKIELQRSISVKNQTVESDVDSEDDIEMSVSKPAETSSSSVIKSEQPYLEVCVVSKLPDSSNRIRCQYCPATFLNNKNLGYHIERKHLSERK